MQRIDIDAAEVVQTLILNGGVCECMGRANRAVFPAVTATKESANYNKAIDHSGQQQQQLTAAAAAQYLNLLSNQPHRYHKVTIAPLESTTGTIINSMTSKSIHFSHFGIDLSVIDGDKMVRTLNNRIL